MNEFQIVHRDDMETNGNWTLCRRALDLGSLGMGSSRSRPAARSLRTTRPSATRKRCSSSSPALPCS